MNIPRFFITPESIDESQKSIVCQDAKLSKQVRKVLRLEKGAKLAFLDGKGKLYHCILEDSAPNQNSNFLKARIESQEFFAPQSPTAITVALPLIKANRFEWALEKLTELGIDTIIPVAVQRSVIKISNANPPELKSKFSRWQKIIQEASEQCERSVPPNLLAPILFTDWLSTLSQSPCQMQLICVERQDNQSIENLLCNQKVVPSSCAIALGAEGGFTEEEIKLALSHNFQPISLARSFSEPKLQQYIRLQ